MAAWRLASAGRIVRVGARPMSTEYAERIVCLTEETTETLYLLG